MPSDAAMAGQMFSQTNTSPLVMLKISLRAFADSPAHAMARAGRALFFGSSAGSPGTDHFNNSLYAPSNQCKLGMSNQGTFTTDQLASGGSDRYHAEQEGFRFLEGVRHG
jgi:hypothetical protein